MDSQSTAHPRPPLTMVSRGCTLLIILQVLFAGISQAAPVMFDPANYTSLVKSDPSATIKPGTEITLQNWKLYKSFLPFGIQVLYTGQYRWKMTNSPDFTITVGPTIDYTWPRQYLEDTEKYGDQTRLVKIDTGGYAIENYVAGLPFPIPDHSQFGYKISYNVRYSPGAAVALWPFTGLSVDEFLNVRTISGTLEFYRLSHLSTPGKPVNPAYGKGYLNSIRADLTAPEDVRYLVQVTLQPEDPTRVSEQYVFVPWIRRSLRLSAGSRCTYQNNSDAANRDLSVDVANYRVKLLGAATILALEHPVSDPAVLYNQYNIQVQSSVPGWPKPALGRWEPRRVYMIDSMPLPVLGNYCVSHSVAYVDADSWVPMVVEDYDTEGRLWRIYVNTWMEVRGPKNEGNYMVLHHNEVLNLKEGHATLFTITSPPMIDSEVPLQYRNAAQSAMPGALSFINK